MWTQRLSQCAYMTCPRQRASYGKLIGGREGSKKKTFSCLWEHCPCPWGNLDEAKLKRTQQSSKGFGLPLALGGIKQKRKKSKIMCLLSSYENKYFKKALKDYQRFSFLFPQLHIFLEIDLYQEFLNHSMIGWFQTLWTWNSTFHCISLLSLFHFSFKRSGCHIFERDQESMGWKLSCDCLMAYLSKLTVKVFAGRML